MGKTMALLLAMSMTSSAFAESWTESFENGVGRLNSVRGNGDTVFFYDAVNQAIDATFHRYLHSNPSIDRRFALLANGPIDFATTPVAFSMVVTPINAASGSGVGTQIGLTNSTGTICEDYAAVVFSRSSQQINVALQGSSVDPQPGILFSYGETYFVSAVFDMPNSLFHIDVYLGVDETGTWLGEVNRAMPPVEILEFDAFGFSNGCTGSEPSFIHARVHEVSLQLETSQTVEWPVADGGNGHFYEFVEAPLISWSDARAAAASRLHNDIPGHLLTSTSLAENNFVRDSFANGTGTFGWIGASDSAVEGEWRWVEGPESGIQFWAGDRLGSTTPPFNFANWAGLDPTGAGQNFAVMGLGPFDVVQPGEWGDAPNNGNGAPIAGYFVEHSIIDCNNNGIPDATEIADGTSEDCNQNNVPDECEAINPGGTLNVPADFATIQDAIDTACDGAEILVASGTYNEVINFLGKAITLRSSAGSDVTIIDGIGLNDSVVKCVGGEGPTTVLDGFTITGGITGSPSPFGLLGGGMMNQGSSPTIRNCVFEFNAAPQSGGAIANLLGSSPLILGSLFRGNTTGASGGAISSAAGTPAIVNCRFQNNTASDFGGGVYYQSIPGTVSIINSVFLHNVAGAGGAIGASSSDVQITNCSIASSIAFGGGCCEAAQAHGGGTFDRGSSTWSISNSVFWNNADGSGSGSAAQIFITSGSVGVNHSCVQGGFPGTGNVADDPLFIDSAMGNLRLPPESPCVDAGNNDSIPPDSADLDGDGDVLEPLPLDIDGLLRTVCDVDMGAYEFQRILMPQSSDPPNCAIDARQPHDPLNPEARFGWTQVTLDFGCVIAPPLPGFSVTVEQGTPPSIIDAIASENLLTLVLDEPIPPGQWTCITHDASGSQTCLGYLPADVNGDGVSSPSDILAVIDSLNGVVPLPEYATDANRSGVSGPEDILRVIDLLNGAAAFEPWLDAMLSDCPSGN